MYRWDPHPGSPDPVDLRNPIYGFFYEKSPVNPSMSSHETDGLAPFQLSLLDHKNDSSNIEYNPMEVFHKAIKAHSVSTQRRQKKKSGKPPVMRNGYLLYSLEMRPILQDRDPDLTFGDLTRQVAQSWNELPPAQQELYCQRARQMSGMNPEVESSHRETDAPPGSINIPPAETGSELASADGPDPETSP
jgi:hypothetical protein